MRCEKDKGALYHREERKRPNPHEPERNLREIAISSNVYYIYTNGYSCYVTKILLLLSLLCTVKKITTHN